MDFDTVINKRISIRSFKKKKVNFRDVLDAIDAANQSPFAGNQNNLTYLIIESPGSIKNLAKISEQTWLNEAGVVILVLSNDTNLENMYGDRGRIYSRQQAGAAIQTILLKLVDLGLSGCWVGAYTDETIKQVFDIPQHIQIEAIIPIGYALPTPKKRRYKKDLEKVIFWEAWDVPVRPTIFSEGKDSRALRY
jgi:nitroreductase